MRGSAVKNISSNSRVAMERSRAGNVASKRMATPSPSIEQAERSITSGPGRLTLKAPPLMKSAKSNAFFASSWPNARRTWSSNAMRRCGAE